MRPMAPQSQSPLKRSDRWGLALLVALILALWLHEPRAALHTSERSPSAKDAFSAQRALKWIEARGALEPRPGGTEPHARFRAALVESLEQLGLEVEVQETLGRGPSGRVALVRNIVARQFAQAPGKAVLLSAHYDSVGCSPGAANNAAGCASLLEIARALQHGPPLERPLIYLFSDAEEAGLIGAEAFAAQHAWAGDVGCVINLEARGSFGPSVLFQLGGGAPAIEALARAAPYAQATSLADFIYKFTPSDTDYSVFARRGTPGFNFAFLGGVWEHHTPMDELDGLSVPSVQQQGEQALALVRQLSKERIEVWEHEPVVYADFVGIGLVAWPPWLGVVLSATAAWFAWRRTRGDESSALKALVHAGPGVGAAAALALGLVWAEFESLRRHLQTPDAGARSSTGADAALVFTCCAAFFLVASLRFKACSFRQAWIALGSTLPPLALVACLGWSDASHPVLLPALGWCALELALAPGRTASKLRERTALAVLITLALVVWNPIRSSLWFALSYREPFVLALPLVAVLSLAWPLYMLIAERTLRRVALGLITLALLGTMVVRITYPDPHRSLEWLNLRHVYDVDNGTARFEASTFGARLAPQVAKAAEWKPAETPPFPWFTLDRSMYVAPAPRIDAPPPALEVLETTATDDGRLVRCRVRSPRGAPRLHLHLPDEVSIESIAWRGRRLDGGFEGVQTQLLFAFEEDGVEFELRDRAASPSSVHLIDQDWNATSQHRALIAARPGYTHVPRSDGDIVIVGVRRELR